MRDAAGYLRAEGCGGGVYVCVCPRPIPPFLPGGGPLCLPLAGQRLYSKSKASPGLRQPCLHPSLSQTSARGREARGWETPLPPVRPSSASQVQQNFMLNFFPMN